MNIKTDTEIQESHIQKMKKGRTEQLLSSGLSRHTTIRHMLYGFGSTETRTDSFRSFDLVFFY